MWIRSTADQGVIRGRVDWGMVGAIAGLGAIGGLAMLSAASPLPFYAQVLQKHFIALGLGLLLFFFGLTFNYQIYQDQSRNIYIFTLLMMMAVLVFGQVQRGQKAWIRLPYFTFQPSELARITTILVLANFLDKRGNKTQDLSTVVGAFALTAPVMGLILLEPDFSSTLTFFPLLLGMLFCAGVNVGHLVGMLAYGAITLAMPLLWTLVSLHPEWVKASPALAFFLKTSDFQLPLLLTVLGVFALALVVWRFMALLRMPAPLPYFLVGALIVASGICSGVLVDHQLKGYQRNRFVAFLVPKADLRGAAYNVEQAQIAIGSGGFWGKGVFSGTQSQLGFLPERHTDFIYAAIGEEMGFFGTMAVLTLYMTLIWRIVSTAKIARDRYGYLVCCGMAAVYGFYPLVNIGMCLGLMPVAGVPLPLVSYGGSNLAITLFAMGIVANVYSRRYAFFG